MRESSSEEGGRQGRAEGHCASLAAVVFRGMVGRKVPAGPVLSPRQDDQPAVSNIKPTCTRQPILDKISKPSLCRPAHRDQPACPNRPTMYTTSPRLPSKPTPSHYISISPLAAVLTLFVRITPDIRGQEHNSPPCSHFVPKQLGKNCFLTVLRRQRKRKRKKMRERVRGIR